MLKCLLFVFYGAIITENNGKNVQFLKMRNSRSKMLKEPNFEIYLFSQSYHFADDKNLLNINDSPKKLQKRINIDLKLLINWILAKSRNDHPLETRHQIKLYWNERLY